MSHELTHLSLFSGIGGLDLAAEAAGFQTVGQCEWADYPTKVLENHWPDVPRWRDIRTLTGDDFYARTGRRSVTVISGGFPCQPFSVAGKRRGKEDDRYLWPEMCRVISEIRPTWVIGENVPGIVNLALDEVLSDLESQGYTCQTFIIPAAGVDAPHRRERICIVAYSGSRRCDGVRNVCGIRELQKRALGKRQTDQFEQSGKVSATVSNADRDGSSTRRAESEGQQRQTGIANGGYDVSYSDTIRCGMWGLERERIQRSDTPCNETNSGSENVADTHSDRLEEPRMQRLSQESGVSTPDFGWWPAEPNVGRVANGIPSRVDRLKCLGNAVVPQQFSPFFRYIAEIEGVSSA